MGNKLFVHKSKIRLEFFFTDGCIFLPKAFAGALEMVQLNSLGVLRKTEEMLTVTGKFFNVAIGNLHVVHSVVWDYILVEFPTL
jgi:hypothetical protein